MRRLSLLFLLLSAAASSSSASRTRLIRLRKQLQDRAGLAHTHAGNAFADALGQKDPAEAILATVVPPTPKTTTTTSTTSTIPTTTTTPESAVKTTTTTTDAPQKPVPAKPTKNLEKEDVPALEHTEEYLDHGVQGLHLGTLTAQRALNSKKRQPRNLGVGTSWAREGIGYVARSVASSVFAAAAATHQVGGSTQVTQAAQAAMPTSSTTRHVKPLPPGFSHAPAGLLLTKTGRVVLR